jgi:hypothetical protein
MNDQMLVYPTDKVVAVAPDRGIVQAAHTALQAAGVDDERVEILGGEKARDGESTEDDDRGFLASVIRTVRTGFGEEATRLQQLNEAIDAGQYVVQVELPGEDGDTRDDEKRAIGNALHDAGASHVAYYGRLAIEELQIGA